jgi:response regulator RpfG family c-di-GMP phosphodiesterase
VRRLRTVGGWRRAPAVLTAGALVAVAGVCASLGGALPRLENDTVDFRFGMRSAAPPDELLVVEIDDATFSDLGLQWPFPRSKHARAIDRLHEAGAREIVYDVQFTEPTREREDLALYEAVERAGGAVLATSETDGRGNTAVLGGDEGLAEIGATAAMSDLPTDAGGVIRRVGYATGGLRSIAVATARRAGHSPPRAAFGDAGAWIDFRGPPGTVPTVSFSELFRGRVDPARIRGKTVVVGASAPTLQDVHFAATASDEVMSGPEVQANAIWTALHGLPLRSVPRAVDVLIIVLLALGPALATLLLRPLFVALLTGPAALAYAIAAQVAFEAGHVVAVALPLISLAAGTGAMVVVSYVLERRERRRFALHNEVLEDRVRERTKELRETQLELIRRLGQAAELRDDDTGAHIERMSRLCERLALAAGMSPDEALILRHASAMHDIGKIGVPDSILHKPGLLDDDERELMRQHTVLGAEILAGSRSPLLQVAEVVARTHHERWDGSGYPAGLRREEIPLPGRIAAVCDVFDALTSARAYKERWTAREALDEIVRQRGRHFDPRLVDLFVGLFPAAPARAAAPEREPAGALS